MLSRLKIESFLLDYSLDSVEIRKVRFFDAHAELVIMSTSDNSAAMLSLDICDDLLTGFGIKSVRGQVWAENIPSSSRYIVRIPYVLFPDFTLENCVVDSMLLVDYVDAKYWYVPEIEEQYI